jgi:hypothetical protein
MRVRRQSHGRLRRVSLYAAGYSTRPPQRARDRVVESRDERHETDHRLAPPGRARQSNPMLMDVGAGEQRRQRLDFGGKPRWANGRLKRRQDPKRHGLPRQRDPARPPRRRSVVHPRPWIATSAVLRRLAPKGRSEANCSHNYSCSIGLGQERAARQNLRQTLRIPGDAERCAPAAGRPRSAWIEGFGSITGASFRRTPPRQGGGHWFEPSTAHYADVAGRSPAVGSRARARPTSISRAPKPRNPRSQPSGAPRSSRR